MLKVLRQSKTFLRSKIVKREFRRTFLSDSFHLEKEWERRLNLPILKKIDYNDLCYQLITGMDASLRVNIADYDLFCNGITEGNHTEELSSLFAKMRGQPECSLMLDSSQHAAVRYLLSAKDKGKLLTMLEDRLQYGLFPDYYLSCLMMNDFLKENDTVSAARIAALQMIQEDFDHNMLKPFVLYSCLKYLKSDQVWLPKHVEEERELQKILEAERAEEKAREKDTGDESSDSDSDSDSDEEEEEEVLKVRVQYKRNPYYDDHFDIVDTNHLVGKTLHLCGKEVPEAIGVSSQLIGFSIHEKYGLGVDLLNKILNEGISLHTQALNDAKEYTSSKIKQYDGQKEDESKPPLSDEMLKQKDEMLVLLDKVQEKGKLINEDMLDVAENLVKKTVAENETKLIQEQKQLYERWEKERVVNIQSEIEYAERQKVLAEIEKIKKELKDKEEELFFFDNEEHYQLKKEENEIKEANMPVSRIKRKKSQDSDSYIPPEVQKPQFGRT